ncbi:phosphoglycerate dehydrogenase [Kiloniella sp. b19]|uniref:phosphoglycerate dehydrogenase n=1 Tax=Kiloniella sp. GXU_MW_B19 TaxID=3141326 RepID=UPI0031D165A6
MTNTKKTPKVLIADKMSPKAEAVFRERGLDVDVKTGLSPEELMAVIPQYDGLAIRSATKVTSDILEAADHLKVVGRAGIGVDNVDREAATKKGVIVMNTPHGNSVTTAEHTIGMIFALARHLPAANASTHQGLWEKSRFMGTELNAKVLGLIGCGNIGAIVADRALGLKMKVLAYDPFLTQERARDLGVTRVELDELLGAADFITLHVPLTDQTRGIINRDNLAKTRKGVRVINCARGGLVVEADLKEALESGHVAGAALDVFEVEPAKDCVLFDLPNVVLTPHLGASTEEAQENVALQVADQISDFLLNGAISNAVNTPSLQAEEARKLVPFMALAHTLGQLGGQLIGSAIRDVTVEYHGEAADLNTRPLVQKLLSQLLKPTMEGVNAVNSALVAKERGIAVRDVQVADDCDYQSLIRLQINCENGECLSVAGTLFSGKHPRIVAVNEITIEAELAGPMLYVSNDDKPGLIGALGQKLGDAGVNIATFHLGRQKDAPDSGALALVALDTAPAPELLTELRTLPSVRKLELLQFN